MLSPEHPPNPCPRLTTESPPLEDKPSGVSLLFSPSKSSRAPSPTPSIPPLPQLPPHPLPSPLQLPLPLFPPLAPPHRTETQGAQEAAPTKRVTMVFGNPTRCAVVGWSVKPATHSKFTATAHKKMKKLLYYYLYF
jgi:hypothetical protein